MFVGRMKTHIDSRNRSSERAMDPPRAHRILGSNRVLGDKWRRLGWWWESPWESQLSPIHCVVWVSHTLSVPGLE